MSLITERQRESAVLKRRYEYQVPLRSGTIQIIVVHLSTTVVLLNRNTYTRRGMAQEEDDGTTVIVASREQDRYLPIANIGRIMKRSLPKNAKIAKDAKDVVQECVSEFISFITSE